MSLSSRAIVPMPQGAYIGTRSRNIKASLISESIEERKVVLDKLLAPRKFILKISRSRAEPVAIADNNNSESEVLTNSVTSDELEASIKRSGLLLRRA